jgi:oxygen-independent coproporphyrinogen-3 oxidase
MTQSETAHAAATAGRAEPVERNRCTAGRDAADNSPATAPPLWDAGLLRRYDVQGPRYTSYPTALQFRDDFGEQDYRACAAAANASAMPAPLSLYIHIPFCGQLCFYCACTKIVTRNHGRAAVYLQRVYAELERQAALLPGRVVEQVHWGGGTPTFLSADEMSELMAQSRRHFRFAPDDELECSIEVDPRTVTPESAGFLRALGFNRLSLGVQDFDPAVQEAVNRLQPERATLDLIESARHHGFRSISVDLIYGLPKQTRASLERTLQTVITAFPDRIALYNYAHLPRLFRAQRQIRETDLPPPAEKLELLRMSIEQLSAAGYRHIGMDHFALEHDDLYRAQREGRLTRNFQGYSTHRDCDIVGIGMSSIGKVGDCYSQNARELKDYLERVDEGGLPVVRGIRLVQDDLLRRAIIHQLMCHFTLRFADFESSPGFREALAGAKERLDRMQQDGLVDVDAHSIRVTPVGRLLVRNVCMAFDRYLPQTPAGASYSRTV